MQWTLGCYNDHLPTTGCYHFNKRSCVVTFKIYDAPLLVLNKGDHFMRSLNKIFVWKPIANETNASWLPGFNSLINNRFNAWLF